MVALYGTLAEAKVQRHDRSTTESCQTRFDGKRPEAAVDGLRQLKPRNRRCAEIVDIVLASQ